MLNKPTHEVGVTLFGASGTDNATYRDMLEGGLEEGEGGEENGAGDYANIVESHP